MQILRITRGKIQPGSWAEFEKTFLEAVEKVGHVPGLISRSLVQSVKDPDEGFAINLWENMESVERYENSELAKAVTSMIRPFFTGDYRADDCQIRYWNKPF